MAPLHPQGDGAKGAPKAFHPNTLTTTTAYHLMSYIRYALTKTKPNLAVRLCHDIAVLQVIFCGGC